MQVNWIDFSLKLIEVLIPTVLIAMCTAGSEGIKDAVRSTI